MFGRKHYKHLFWDLDNTLFDFDKAAEIALREMFVHFDLPIYFEDFETFFGIYHEINIDLWDKYKHGEVGKDQVKFGRFIKTLEQGGCNNIQIAHEMADHFLDNISEKNVLMPGTEKVISRLSEKYQMHIISNGFREVQYRKLIVTGLSPFFKSVVLSEEVKAQKPSRLIFEKALINVNARKSESLMIGDNYDADILGAKNFGIDQIYIPYNGDISNSKATYSIEKLEKIVEIL